MRLHEIFERPRAREMAGISLTGLCVLSVLTLATYNPQDPSFFSSTGEVASNWIGPIGAAVSAILYEGFGLTAWFLPWILLAAALRRLRGGSPSVRQGAALGLGLVALATAVLLSLLVRPFDVGGVPLLPGGLVGKLGAEGLVALLSQVGAGVVAMIFLLFGMVLAARSSLAESTGDAWVLGRNLLRRAAPLRKRLFGENGLASRKRSWSLRLPSVSRLLHPLRRAPRTRLRTRSADLPRPRTPSPAPLNIAKPPEKKKKSSSRRGQQAKLPVVIKPGKGALPPVDLLDPPGRRQPVSRKELLQTAEAVVSRFQEFKVDGRIDEFSPGPVVTTFEFHPDKGVKLSRITSLSDDLALGLEAESVRMERIPGRSAVGVEVPNKKRETIALREIIDSQVFRSSRDLLTLALGKTQEGEIFCTSLSGMPHLLVAGSTGSGKSVGLNSMITSILYRAQPEEVKFILIDPKMLELGIYEGVPHLLVPVVTDMKLASNALRWAVREMDRRYRLLAACNVRHLNAFNRKVDNDLDSVVKAIESIPSRGDGDAFQAKRMPYIIIVVDELADMLMTTGQEVEDAIARLAQKARAVGIHLILATQRPSVDVLTGAIKANFPARIAFRVASKIDSRTIIDAAGADKLLGAGDMLYRPPGSSRQIRVHGAWISEQEGLRLVAWLKKHAKVEYDKSVLKDPPVEAGSDADPSSGASEDPMYRQALRKVISEGHGSTSFLQRKLKLGYSRAARIVDQMEEDGILGPQDGSRPRKCLVGTDFLERMDQQDLE